MQPYSAASELSVQHSRGVQMSALVELASPDAHLEAPDLGVLNATVQFKGNPFP